MALSHIDLNDAERERLRALVARLSDEDRARPLADGWTVGAALAHLAFWDRLALARWQAHLGDGTPLVALSDEVADLINAAGLEQWLALPSREAARQAVAAAEALDGLVQGLGPEAAEAAR